MIARGRTGGKCVVRDVRVRAGDWKNSLLLKLETAEHEGMKMRRTSL
jgi:hypothetical protein